MYKSICYCAISVTASHFVLIYTVALFGLIPLHLALKILKLVTKGHSTNHAVITLVERVAKALDTGIIVVGVYLDIRKACDAIDHPILLRKLYSLGIPGNLYTWTKSYLTNISQFVMYNNSKSETKFITHGVPQGSILGLLFFIVFMNDFSRASSILFSILFADDTTVIIEGQNYNNLILTLNTELNKLDVRR